MEATLKKIILAAFRPVALLLAILTDTPSLLSWPKNEARTATDEKCEDTPCMACQAVIPAGADTCSKCGWSYNVSDPVDDR
jgi:ribosomal protein L40E